MITLKNVLLINGISSGLTGLLLVSFSEFISGIFGLTNHFLIVAVGIFLLLFATLVILVGVQTHLKSGMVKLISFLDASWVIASLVIIFLQPGGLSLIGSVLILAVALWVALMAILQIKNLNQSIA